MKRNFQAIDAIAFAFGFGFKGFSILLRLGWPAILLYVGGLALMMKGLGGIEALIAPYAVAMQEMGVDLGGAIAGWTGTGGTADPVALEEPDPAETLAFAAIALGSSLLMVPAYTALIRAGAGRSVRGGVLPLFGRAELYLIAGYILSYLVIVAILILLALAGAAAFFGSAALLGGPESGAAVAVGCVLGVAALLAFLWLTVRISLWPGIAAVSEDLSIGRAFALSKGRFWKLLGSFLLFGLLLGALSIVLQMVMLGLFATEMVLPALGLYGLLMLYTASAQMGFYGRIIGDLLIDPENPGRYDDTDFVDDGGDEEAQSLDQDLSDEQALAEPPVMMRRQDTREEGPASAIFAAASETPAQLQHGRSHRGSSISFVRRRFRG
jgi:hypothetical protein